MGLVDKLFGSYSAKELKRELWRRMVFNAVCGNGDDHPRNHGLLFRDGNWTLADAFDIAPYITFSGTLAMAVTRDGDSMATSHNLLMNCDNFGWERAEARQFIERCRDTVAQGWSEELADCGEARDLLPAPAMSWLD